MPVAGSADVDARSDPPDPNGAPRPASRDLHTRGAGDVHGCYSIGDHILRGVSRHRKDPTEGFLRAGPNVRRSTSQSGSYRLDARGARIPQRELTVQRRYGTAFRSLLEMEREAARLARAARRLADIAREGLGAGDLEPGGA